MRIRSIQSRQLDLKKVSETNLKYSQIVDEPWKVGGSRIDSLTKSGLAVRIDQGVVKLCVEWLVLGTDSVFCH